MDRMLLIDKHYARIASILSGKPGDPGRTAADNRIKSLTGDPDFEYAIVDGTIVRVHKHGTGAKGGLAIRPSAGREEA